MKNHQSFTSEYDARKFAAQHEGAIVNLIPATMKTSLHWRVDW